MLNAIVLVFRVFVLTSIFTYYTSFFFVDSLRESLLLVCSINDGVKMAHFYEHESRHHSSSSSSSTVVFALLSASDDFDSIFFLQLHDQQWRQSANFTWSSRLARLLWSLCWQFGEWKIARFFIICVVNFRKFKQKVFEGEMTIKMGWCSFASQVALFSKSKAQNTAK